MQVEIEITAKIASHEYRPLSGKVSGSTLLFYDVSLNSGPMNGQCCG